MRKVPDILSKDFLSKKISYSSMDDKDILNLIGAVREGIKYTIFISITHNSPFSLNEWSHFLHLSERTMQRYKREKRTFDPIHSERIVEITLLYKTGIEVFGDEEMFNSWLDTKNLVLGGMRPKDLLDTTFGISLLKDELTRIEHGILA